MLCVDFLNIFVWDGLVKTGAGYVSDEEDGHRLSKMAARDSRRISPIELCRNKSGSAWLHFPHVELVFLFFAFEGAVGSQVAAIRDTACLEVYITAIAAFVSFGGRIL